MNAIPPCPICWGTSQHLRDCPEAMDPPAEVCGMCGCDLEDDEIQLCSACAAEHPGD